MTMRRRAVLTAVVILTSVFWFRADSDASCAFGGTVSVSPDKARPGDLLTLRGSGWAEFPCNDTGPEESWGCGESRSDEPGTPFQGIKIRLVGPEKTLLAEVDAEGRRGTFQDSVELPRLEPGLYDVIANYPASPAFETTERVTITVLSEK